MPEFLSKESVILLARAAFLVGALTDGLAFFPMLSARLGGRVFGGRRESRDPSLQFAWGIGAALMLGWTLLLLWGAIRPLERLELLPLTVFPVIFGIVWATVYAVRQQLIPRRRMLPLWLHLGVVSSAYLLIYWLALSWAE